MALAAASLSNGGEWIPLRLAMGVENPQGGWVMLPVSGKPQPALLAQTATNTAEALGLTGTPIWQVVAGVEKSTSSTGRTSGEASGYTWYLGGTLSEWKGAPLAIAVLLEENNPQVAQEIGRSMLQNAMYP